MALRPYQVSSIQKLRKELSSGKKRVIYYLPTGGGKSKIAAALIELAKEKGKRVAFVANRIELVGQMSEHLNRHGIPHGIIQGDNSYNSGAQVVVCSIQTLVRRLVQAFDFIIIDEAHGCAGSGAYRGLLARLNNVPVIGLTATPFSKGLGKEYKDIGGPLFESIVVGSTIPELIEMGFLVDVEIYAPSEPDLSKVKMVAGDYDERQLGVAVDKPGLVGDIVSHWLRLAKGKRTIVFATNVAHSKHIVEQFQAAGVRAIHVDGYMAEEERRPIIDAFKRGDYEILSNCSLLAEGFDCPETEAIILARPTRSLIRYIQMAGRALRPHHSKDRAIILDHSGTVRRLGFPTDELPLELDDGKPKEKKEERKDLPKVCPQCFAVRPKKTPKCPSCGFEAKPTPQDIEHEAGELRKLEKKDVKRWTKEEKQSIYSALWTIKEAKGYKGGWAANGYREIVGVWPRELKDVCGPSSEIVDAYLTHKAIKWAKGQGAKRSLI